MIFQNIRNRDEHTIYYACIILCVRNFTAFSNKLTSFYGYSYADKLQYFFVTTSSSKKYEKLDSIVLANAMAPRDNIK